MICCPAYGMSRTFEALGDFLNNVRWVLRAWHLFPGRNTDTEGDS